MPDWTYQTVLRPALLWLGPQEGQNVALGIMGLLSRLPLGKRVIQLMGHMKPDSRLVIERNGCTLPTSVGLGCALDPHLSATPAFAEFGFGFLEIGPIVANPPATVGTIHLDAANESLRFEPPQATLTPIAASGRLKQDGPFPLPIFARIEPSSPEEARQFLDVLASCVDGFVVSIDRLEAVCGVRRSNNNATTTLQTVFAAVDVETWLDQTNRERCAQAVREGEICGIVVAEAAPSGDSHSPLANVWPAVAPLSFFEFYFGKVLRNSSRAR